MRLLREKQFNHFQQKSVLNLKKNPLYKPRDPRLAASFILPGDSTPQSPIILIPPLMRAVVTMSKNRGLLPGYMIKKYIDENDRSTGNGSLDLMLCRYAEVLLDYVECLVETGDWQNPDVEKYINMIRHRAGMPNMDKNVYNTQEKVRELYRRERRVELCFEGKRYDDIRRWGIR